MGKRRSALRDVLTVEQYREMLRNAARIKDREESISLFFFLVMMGRVGLRVGEVIHMQASWFNPDRSTISVQPHVNCDCGLCRHYAKNWAEQNDLDFEEVLDEYWKVKDGSDRDVHVWTERGRDIIKLYFEEVPYTKVSYSTVNRRLKKIAELTDGVSPSHIYSHMMRATAASHLAWAGFAPALLDLQFGWEDEKTKERYIKKTGYQVKLEFDRILNRDDEDSRLQLREDPPTYGELRPDDEEELIEVESWSVNTSVETHPRHRDEEPLIHNLDEYNAAFEPVSSIVRARLEREYEQIQDNPELDANPPIRRVGAAGGGMLSTAAVSGSLLATNGFFEDILAGEPIAIASLVLVVGTYLPWMVYNVHELFHEDTDDIEPETLLDCVIIWTHSAVNWVISLLRNWRYAHL